MSEHVKEEILTLGPRRTLVAISSISSQLTTSPHAPTLLILNAGIIHRVGPNRLHVVVARALAREGYRAVRVDLSGIGDSINREEAMSPLETALTDIREALDSLEANRGARRFVLMGLCSGADHAAIYAGTDSRVVGMVLIDPSIPQTFQHYMRFLGSRVIRLLKWQNLSRLGQKLRILTRAAVHGQSVQPPLVLAQMSAREARSFMARAYKTGLDQGVQILAVFTDGRQDLHSYRDQMRDAFSDVPFGNQLRLEYFDRSDHTLSLLADRNKLVAALIEWMEYLSSGADATSKPKSGLQWPSKGDVTVKAT